MTIVVVISKSMSATVIISVITPVLYTVFPKVVSGLYASLLIFS